MFFLRGWRLLLLAPLRAGALVQLFLVLIRRGFIAFLKGWRQSSTVEEVLELGLGLLDLALEGEGVHRLQEFLPAAFVARLVGLE